MPARITDLKHKVLYAYMHYLLNDRPGVAFFCVLLYNIDDLSEGQTGIRKSL